MDLGSVILSEVGQIQEEKFCMISLICRNDTNELTKQKETHRLQELWWLGEQMEQKYS